MNERLGSVLRLIRSAAPRTHTARATFIATALALASSGAVAEVASRVQTIPQLWVTQVLVACVAGLIAFIASRWWALAGIVLVVAVWYALPPVIGPQALAEAVERFGSRYPFHAQASVLLVPLVVLMAFGARFTATRRPGGAA